MLAIFALGLMFYLHYLSESIWGSFIDDEMLLVLIIVSGVTFVGSSIVGVISYWLMMPSIIRVYIWGLLILSIAQYEACTALTRLTIEYQHLGENHNLTRTEPSISTSLLFKQAEHTFDLLYQVHSGNSTDSAFTTWVHETCAGKGDAHSLFEKCLLPISDRLSYLLMLSKLIGQTIGVLQAIAAIAGIVWLMSCQYKKKKRTIRSAKRYGLVMPLLNAVYAIGGIVCVITLCWITLGGTGIPMESYIGVLSASLLLIASLITVAGVFMYIGVKWKNNIYLKSGLIGLVLVLMLQLVLMVIFILCHIVLTQLLIGDKRINSAPSQKVLDVFRHTYTELRSSPGAKWFSDWVEKTCSHSSSRITDKCLLKLARPVDMYIKESIEFCAAVAIFEILLLILNCSALCLSKFCDLPSENGIDSHLSSKLNYEQALKGYLLCIRKNKGEAKREFDEEWKETCNIQGNELDAEDSMYLHQLEALHRRLIIQRLTRDCRLDVSVSLSRTGKHIYCKISASERVLAYEAEKMKYNMQLKETIDPGTEVDHSIVCCNTGSY